MEYIADKLVHPSAETRGRALESLEFKWKYGLVGAAELLQDRKVLKGLLGLLNIGDGVQTTAVALLLLRKMASADARLAKALLELGALQQLHAFTSKSSASPRKPAAAPRVFITPGVWPDELVPSVEAFVNLLISPAGGTSSVSGSSTSAALRASTSTSRPSQQYDSAATGARSSSTAASSAMRQNKERGESYLASAGRASAAGPVHPVFGRLQQQSAAASDTRPGSSTCSVASSGSVDAASSASPKCSAASSAVQRPQEAPSGHSNLRQSLVGDNPHHSAAAAAGRAAAVGADSGDTSLFDERLLRAKARADWRQQEQGLTPKTEGVQGPGSWPILSTPGLPPGHLTLPVVVLSAADDQALFELNVRLQYSDDERLLLPALLELGGVVGLDLPAEALLQRQSILDNCLALLSSSRYSKQVHHAAAAVLLQLVTGLKLSLALAQQPELAHSEYGDSIVAATAAAAAGISPSSAANGTACEVNKSFPNHPGGNENVLAAIKLVPGFTAAAKALAAAKAPVLDPTCPNTYPQLPLPESGPDTPWQLPMSIVEDQRVDVTAAVNSICLQVMELLSHADRHYEILPLIEAAMPQLTAPIASLSSGTDTAASSSSRQQLHDEMHALWRGLLASLSRALASTAAVAAGDRAAAVAASLSGQPAAASNALVVLAAAGGGPAPGIGGAGLCCWDIASVNLLQLTLRLLQAAPADWCNSAIVPPSLADALATAACDGVLALLHPELRSGAHPLLEQLRPADLAALEAADSVKSAIAAAEEAAGPLLQQLLQQPVLLAARWLQRVQDALPGLGFNPRTDARLLQCVLHGLAVISAGCSADDSNMQTKAGELLVQLLSHQQQQVQQMVLQLLVSATATADEGNLTSGYINHQQQQQHLTATSQLEALQQLLMLPVVSEHLVVQGLADPRTQGQVSRVLLGLLRHLGYRGATWLMPWRCWISSSASSATQGSVAETGELAQALEAYRAQGLAQQRQQGLDEFGGVGFWESPAVGVLQDLYNVDGERRRSAGRQLLQMLVGKEEASAAADDDEYADDPFRGLLDSHSNSSSSSRKAQQQQHHHLPPDALTDSSTALAANFTAQDVRNLLGVLFNEGLAQELRRSAADELLALSPVPHLMHVMVQEDILDKIWQLCVPNWIEQSSHASAAADVSVGAGPPSGGIFDMQLTVAALQLLAGVIARSPEALSWMTDQPHRMLVPLMPLVLHTLHSVRRAIARVLALVLFGTAANKWTGFGKAAAAIAASAAAETGLYEQDIPQDAAAVLLPTGVRAVLLPEPFLQQYKFPFKVLGIPVTAAAAAAATDDANTFSISAACIDVDQAHAASQQRREHNQRQQQQYIIKQLVEQQQLLAAADFNPATARQLLQDCLPPHLQHISQRVLSATANQLFNCDPQVIAQRLLAAVATAGSHAECEQALRQLERLSSSQQGLQAIAAAGSSSSAAAAAVAAARDGDTAAAIADGSSISWQSAFERLLGTAPITAEDQRLWLQLLRLVEKMLKAVQLSEVQYTYLQLLLQRSVSAWLQQPSTAAEVPRPPLALAAGTNSWELLKQQPTSGAAAAAVADMLGITAAGEPAAAAAAVGSSDEGLLRLQVSRQALRVLLQLVTAVKTHCCITHSSSSSTSSAVQCYSLAALQPAGLMQLLCSNLIGTGDNVDYSCKVLAAAMVAEVAGALQDVARLQALISNLSIAQQQQQQGSVATAPLNPKEEACVLVDCLEPLITKVLMPVAGKQLPGFRGKSLVKAALQVLLVVVDGPLVPVGDWSQVWAAVGGYFWISRLSRDREASIRCMALSLLQHLLSPAAPATQALIAHNWPDCVNRLVRVACDACEAYAVRAAAVRALTAAMVVPREVLQGPQQQQQGQQQEDAEGGLQQQQQQQSKKLHSFGLAAILQLEQIWLDLVPALLLQWQQRPLPLVAAAAALAAAAMAAEPDGVGRKLLLQARVAAAALQLITAATDTGSSSSSNGLVQQRDRYMQHLQQLHITDGSLSVASKLLAAPCGLAAAAAAAHNGQAEATLALQHRIACLAAATAAAHLVSMAAAPASEGGGLLLLPAAVQDVLAAVPAVLMRLIALLGNQLVPLNSSSSSAITSGPDITAGGQPYKPAANAVMLQLQQQLTAMHVSAAAVLSAPIASPPEQQRQQLLLHLVVLASHGQQSTDGSSSSNDSNQRLLRAICNGLSHTASTPGLKLVLIQLLGLIMSDAAAAAAALGMPGSSDAVASSSSSSSTTGTDLVAAAVGGYAVADNSSEEAAAVGAALCRELAALLPASIFTPAAAAAAPITSGSSSTAPTVATPEGLVVIFALQNLLTYSKAAKAAAVDLGLHKLLMETARAMAAALTVAAAAAGQSGSSSSSGGAGLAAAGGSLSVLASRTRARWFSYKPGAATTPATAAAAAAAITVKRVAFGRGSSGSVTADVSQGASKGLSEASPSTAAAAAGPKRSAGPRAAGTLRPSRQQQLKAKQQQQQKLQQHEQGDLQTADDSAAAAAAAGEVEGAALQHDDSQGLPATGTAAAEAADLAPTAAAAAGDDDASTVHHRGSGGSKQQQLSAVKSLHQRKLLLSLVLLRHLSYGCTDTQAALVGDGLIDVLLQLWPLALTHMPLLLELLLLLANILPHCYQARLAAASLGQPQATLLQQLLQLLLPPAPQPQPAGSSNTGLAAVAAAAGHGEVVRLATAALVAYASTEDGACQLVKAGSDFLPEAQKCIRWCLISLRREQERQQQRQLQQQRLSGLLQLLSVITGRLEGQRAMLKATVAPALVDLLVEVLLLLPQQGAAATAAPVLLLIRNLAFHADLRGPALANQQLLPLLLAAAESLQPEQQQQQDMGALSRPGSSDGSSGLAGLDSNASAVPPWAPLYGKPVTATPAAAATAAGLRGAAGAAGSSGSRPDSPAVGTSAGAVAARSVAVAGAVGNVCCAVYAVSALWALMFQGEKVKAAFRKIPRASARLTAVKNQAQQLLLQQQQVVSKGPGTDSSSKREGDSSNPLRDISNAAAREPPVKHSRLGSAAAATASQQQKGSQSGFSHVVAAAGVRGCEGLVVDPGSPNGIRDASWWLRQLLDSCEAVLDIMESV